MGPIYYILVAFPCAIGAVALAVSHIYRHLLNYTEPTYQRYIVRIIFMVPVYALMSFMSLVLNGKSIYFNSIREIRFIRRCKQGGLQFVILKPILVTLTFVLYARGKYEDGNFSAKQAYLYLTIVYTISYSMALYALALFYMACRDLLRPFNPVPKFILIKSVVFLTYWQGVMVFLAAKSGFIKTAEEAADFQNFLICVEMLVAAVGHLYAFPYKEYAGANIGASGGLTRNFAHALKINDFYHDTVHQFAPTYHDYVLYKNEGDEGATKYRSRTFVPTGQEMDAVRRNKNIFGNNKIDDIQLCSVSSSEADTPEELASSQKKSADPETMKSLSLLDSSSSYVEPYDLSLIDLDLTSFPSEVPAVKDS